MEPNDSKTGNFNAAFAKDVLFTMTEVKTDILVEFVDDPTDLNLGNNEKVVNVDNFISMLENTIEVEIDRSVGKPINTYEEMVWGYFQKIYELIYKDGKEYRVPFVDVLKIVENVLITLSLNTDDFVKGKIPIDEGSFNLTKAFIQKCDEKSQILKEIQGKILIGLESTGK